MLRVAFNLFAVLSLLIFIVAAGMWVRGQSVSDTAKRVMPDYELELATSRSGVALIYIGDLSATRYGADPGWSWDKGEAVSIADWHVDEPEIDFLHVVYQSQNPWGLPGGSVLHVPYWLMLTLSLPGPIAWMIHYPRHGRARRLRLGLCVKCGYDLRGSAGACPECGTPRRVG